MIKRTDKKNIASGIIAKEPGVKIRKSNSRAATHAQATRANRAKALDELRDSTEVRNAALVQSVRHSQGAFDVLQKNAAKPHDMASQAKFLQDAGKVGRISSNELEVLLSPVPPSLHFRTSSDLTSPTRVDCVLSLGEPEPTGETRRILLRALQVMQWGNIHYEQKHDEKATLYHQITLPEGAIQQGVNGLPAPNERVICDLFVRNTEATHIKIHQGQNTLVDLDFAPASVADSAMLASLSATTNSSKYTFAHHKSTISVWCKWSQAQREAGVFRPLLKDLLMRRGDAKYDPDLQVFNTFIRATKGLESEYIDTRSTFAAFNAARFAGTISMRDLSPVKSQKLETFSQQNIGRSPEEQAKMVDILGRVENWLAKNRPGLTLEKICGPDRPMEDHEDLLTVLSDRLGKAAKKKEIRDSLFAFSVFLQISTSRGVNPTSVRPK
jgi:hypothetical protein